MSTLTPLHDRLLALRAQRSRGRTLRAVAALGLSIVGALLVLFLVDWSFFLGRFERIVALALVVTGVIYGFRRHAWPWLARREDQRDVALLVERSQQIDSDLIAALQFESPAARYGSSTALAEAVVDRGAHWGREVDWEHTGLETAHRRPLKALAIALALLALLGLVFPGHVKVFVNRLLLGSRHYPADTLIDEVRVGKTVVALGDDEQSPVRSPFGQPATFRVRASGKLPERGEVRLSTADGASPVTIELTPLSDEPGVYVGEFPRLVEDVRFQVFVGDDWIEPRLLLAIPLPVVALTVDAEPPEYAKAVAGETDADSGSRQIAVVEGSRVTVGIECRNKSLQVARITIGGQEFPLQSLDDRRRNWRLPPSGTPLDRVVEGLRYSLDVVDSDGLSLAEPIEGFVRIKGDRPPRVTAAVVTQHVLPTAKPQIAYGAIDDFGIAGLRLLCVVAREDGSTVEHVVEVPLPSIQPLVQGRYPLELAKLRLNRGDQVRITLEARDHRGDNPGKTALAEPIVLQVTDERGVLAAMTETDQRTARQMDLIIQRQLGLGEGP